MRAVASRRGYGTTSICSTSASTRATPFACSAASSASAGGCRCRCAPSRRRRTPIRPRSPFPAAGCGRARRILRVPRLRDLARGPRRSRRLVRSRRRCPKALRSLPAASADGHHGYAGGLLEHTVGVATLCRETAQLHPRLRHDIVLAAALLHDVGRIRELGPGPAFRQTDEGRLLGHVHLGLRMIEERGRTSTRPCSPSCCTRSRVTTTDQPREPPSSRSLPREPARRAGRDAPRRRLTRGGTLALAGALGWGVGDFLGGLARGAWRFSPSSRSHRPSAWSACLLGDPFARCPSRRH